jgi:hypothetical protein
MRLLHRKSEPERILNTVEDPAAVLNGGVNRSKLVKAGLITGGLAALIAGSAAISSIRRRREEIDS